MSERIVASCPRCGGSLTEPKCITVRKSPGDYTPVTFKACGACHRAWLQTFKRQISIHTDASAGAAHPSTSTQMALFGEVQP